MLLNHDGKVRQISAKLSDEEFVLAKAYIQGAVHSFCKNNPDQDFSGRILFGGANRDWRQTPLQKLYDYHLNENHSDPASQAAKDMGLLLKVVLAEDERFFEETGKDTGQRYRLVP